MYGRLAQLAHVVRKDFRTKSNGNSLRPLRQKQGKLHGQCDWFFVSAVVASLPLRGFGIENGVECELRKPRLDITWGGGTVAREDVSPVSLRVDKQVFLPHLHKGVADRGVAVGVKLHGVAHNVGHFVVPSVVHAFHRVQYTALNRFQAVGDVGHGAFQDNVRGVVEEPILVHATKVMHRRGIEAVGGFIVGMRFNALFLVFVLFLFVGHVQAFFQFVRVFYFVVHSVSFLYVCISARYISCVIKLSHRSNAEGLSSAYFAVL